MLVSANTEKAKTEFLSAMGVEETHQQPAWPLPNQEPSTETDFWSWRATWSFNGEAWLGQRKIGDEFATVLVYYVGHSQYIDGGFAVAVFRRWQHERVEYFTWKACVHDFTEKNIGHCLHRYTCKNCGKSFDVDSSG